MDTKVLPYGKVCSSEFETKDFDVDNGKEYSWEFKCKKKLCGFMWGENREIKHTVVTKNIACTGKSANRETMMDYSDITNTSVPIPDKGDDSSLVSGIKRTANCLSDYR